MPLLIGNIVALLGSIVMILVGYVKTKKQVLIFQTIQIILLTISNLILGGITGAIVNIVSIIRNILSYKEKLNKPALILIILASIIIPIIFNTQGIIGFLPIIATVAYTINLNTKNVVKLKYTLIFSMVIWCIYDICILSISSAFDLFTIVAAVISIVQIKKQEKKGAPDYSDASR